MTAIQMAVLDLIKSCISELKTSNPAVGLWAGHGVWFHIMFLPQLEMDEVTVEMCMGKAFDVVIRHQLDPLWNQLVHVLYTVGNLRNCFVDQWRVLCPCPVESIMSLLLQNRISNSPLKISLPCMCVCLAELQDKTTGV